MSLKLGAHFSIAGGLENALRLARTYGCDVAQLFTKNASTWKERSLDEKETKIFKNLRKKLSLNSVISHTSYLINPASPDKEKRNRSLDALEREMERAGKLDLDFVVMHPGSHMGAGIMEGLNCLVRTIDECFDRLPDKKMLPSLLLIETGAGQGNGIGHDFNHLAFVLEKSRYANRLGVCLDTCHIFASGYDIQTEETCLRTMETFKRIVGLDRLFLLHLNDSKKPLGSRVDRHEHIGEGFIGKAAFSFFMNEKRFVNMPKIIETPKEKKGPDRDKINLNVLRKLAGEIRFNGD